MIEWASPWYFSLLVLVAGLVYWFFRNHRKMHASIQFSAVSRFRGLAPGLRVRLMGAPALFKFLALVFFVFALARPQESSTRIKRNVEGIDIMISLDISDSMLIEDMQPVNRMESAKKIIKEFIEGRVSDRIGLVVFSGESYTRMPLTLDYEVLQKTLKETEPSTNMKMGTAIGVALANAVGRLRESTAKTRVAILVTDGENNSGTIDPETALKIAQGYGIRVYTIGMGIDGDAQLPIYTQDAFGRKVKRYQPIHSKINEELLGKIAQTTGGKFYRASTTDALKGVFSEINDLEKTKIDVSKFTRYTELFPTYLAIALMLYIASFVLGRTVLRRSP